MIDTIYESVFVILPNGKERQYDNAKMFLFDNQLTIIVEGTVRAVYNFNNIVGVNCYEHD